MLGGMLPPEFKALSIPPQNSLEDFVTLVEKHKPVCLKKVMVCIIFK